MPKGLSTTHLQTRSRANLTPRLLNTPIGGTQSQGTVHGDKSVHHVRRSRPAPRGLIRPVVSAQTRVG